MRQIALFSSLILLLCAFSFTGAAPRVQATSVTAQEGGEANVTAEPVSSSVDGGTGTDTQATPLQPSIPLPLPPVPPLSVPPPPVDAELQALILQPVVEVSGVVLDRPALEAVYGASSVNFRSLWGDGQKVRTILTTLTDSSVHALNPEDYHVSALRTLVASASSRREKLELDLMLTDGLMRYASDVRVGRVNPRQVKGQRFIRSQVLDPAMVALEAAAAPDLGGFLANLPPQSALYKGQVRLLDELRRQADWPSVPSGPKLQKGQTSARVKALRERLMATGDLGIASAEEELFDADLVDAVTTWQSRSGLKADGVVGSRSLAELNISRLARIDQVVANMERQRWLPDDLGARHVRVNVPAYTLYAVQDGRTDLVMKTIVGRPDRPTPLFSDAIRFVEFNPTWSVPSTIAREDVLPNLIKNPGYALEHKNVRIYRNGVEVDPWSVDWSTANIRTYTLRAPPGPRNPLGTVKFLFPNAFDVYLHDTSERQKFAEDERALSSGCVRVSDPAGLANWLLADKPGWSDAKRQRILDGGKQTRLDMAAPVPVWLTYTTAWLDEETGRPAFRPDLYGLDAELSNAIRASEGKPRRLAVSMVRAQVNQPVSTDPTLAPGAVVPQAAP